MRESLRPTAPQRNCYDGAMLGPDDLVLCAGTVRQAGLRELVAAAAAGGFQGISLYPQLYDETRAGGLSDADIRHLLEDHGLEIAEHDALLTWLPGGPSPEELPDELGRALFSRTADDFFRIADAVGGRSLNVAQVFPANVDVTGVPADVIFRMGIFMGPILGTLYLIPIGVYLLYQLDRRRHAAIHEQLAAMRRARMATSSAPLEATAAGGS